MLVAIFTIPFDSNRDLFDDEELVYFLLDKRIRSVHPVFFQHQHRPYWSVFVEYESLPTAGETSTDAASDLDENQRRLLERLYDWRREKAQQQGTPVYIVATNKQLDQLVRRAPATLEEVRKISGFGKKKVERHGQEMIDIIKGFYEPIQDNPPAETGKTL